MVSASRCAKCRGEYTVCRLCGQTTCCECNSTYVDDLGRLSSVSQLMASGSSPEGHIAHFDCISAGKRPS